LRRKRKEILIFVRRTASTKQRDRTFGRKTTVITTSTIVWQPEPGCVRIVLDIYYSVFHACYVTLVTNYSMHTSEDSIHIIGKSAVLYLRQGWTHTSRRALSSLLPLSMRGRRRPCTMPGIPYSSSTAPISPNLSLTPATYPGLPRRSVVALHVVLVILGPPTHCGW
jgi:hypothetical protein